MFRSVHVRLMCALYVRVMSLDSSSRLRLANKITILPTRNRYAILLKVYRVRIRKPIVSKSSLGAAGHRRFPDTSIASVIYDRLDLAASGSVARAFLEFSLVKVNIKRALR